MAYTSQTFSRVFQVTSNNDGTFTLGRYFTGSYVATDTKDLPGDNLTQLGDIGGDHFTSTGDVSTATGIFIGTVGQGKSFVGYDTTDKAYYFYADSSYTMGQTVTPNGNTSFVFVCYAAGTRIRVSRAGVSEDVAVEALRIGDDVVTASGACRPIKWIGHRAYSGRFANSNPDVLPICFKAGSLAENVPVRDLWVSPKHAMFLDGVLIPAEHLVNGVTIVKAAQVETVEFWHVELDSHDILIAEGAASESYLDDDNRAFFHNAPEFDALYPDAVATEPVYCAPRVEDGHGLEAVRQRLAARARTLTVDVEADRSERRVA